MEPPEVPVAFEDANLMTPEVNAAFQVLYKYQIFRGVGGTAMDSAGPIKRGEFAALLHRAFEVIPELKDISSTAQE